MTGGSWDVHGEAGAAGSTETPPNPWKGISGPPGPLGALISPTSTGVRSDTIEWSVQHDPGCFNPAIDSETRIASMVREVTGLNGIIDRLREENASLRSGWGHELRVQLDAEARHWRKKFEDAQAENATLKSSLRRFERGMTAAILQNYRNKVAALEARVAAFTDGNVPASDLPPLPRRPDGTLAPQLKPWSPPKSQGDSRRIGT